MALGRSQSYWLDELYSVAIHELVRDFLFRRNLTSFGMVLVAGAPLGVIIRAAMTIVPLALADLEGLYELHHRHLDASGRGHILFRASPKLES